MPQAALLTDPETNTVLYANPAAAKLFDCSQADLEKFCFENLHANPASARHFSNNLRYALESNRFLFIPEVKLKTFSGRCFPCQLDLSPLCDPKGKIIAWLNVVTDITSLKNYREQLYGERNILAELLETARIIVLVTDKNGRIVLSNPFLDKLCRLDAQKIKGHKWTAVLLDRSHAKTADSLLKKSMSLPEGCQHRFEFCVSGTHERKNIDLHIKAIHNEQGSTDGFLLVGQDVTEHESALKRLAELGKTGVELERIVNASPAVAFVWEGGKRRNIRFVSKNIRQFGYESQNLVEGGIDYLELVHPEDRRILVSDFELFKQDCVGKFFRRLYRLKTASGKMRWVEERTWAEFDTNLNVVDFRAVVWDATQRISATQMLDDSKKLLEQQKLKLLSKDAAIDEMLKHMEAEKQRLSEQIEQNIRNFVLPALLRLKAQARKTNLPLVNQLESNFESVTGAFGINLVRLEANLSPRELEICNMIRCGLSSKDIAAVLGISPSTATRHRNNIRTKLGIVGKHTSLSSFLHTLD